MYKVIGNTAMGKLFHTENVISDLSKFIVGNRSVIYQDDYQKTVFTPSKTSSSIITSMYNDICELIDKKNIFAPINISNMTTGSSHPEVLNVNWFAPDVKLMRDQSKLIDPLSSFPEYHEKIILNIFPYWNNKHQAILDGSTFTHVVVRETLSRSYTNAYMNNDDIWLTTDVVVNSAKIYAELMHNNFKKLNIDNNDLNIIKGIFGIYFINLCVGHDKHGLYSHLEEIITKGELTDAINLSKEYNNGELPTDLHHVAEIISKLGPEILTKIDVNVIFTYGRIFYENNTLSSIAIEYPPYWLFLLLLTASKENRSPMYSFISKSSKLKNILNNLVKKITSKPIINPVFD